MDIPRPENFNECYLYEGMVLSRQDRKIKKLTALQS